MNMWTIAWYEIVRMLRMRYVLLIQFVMPLLLIFILGSALSGAFRPEDKAIKPVQVDVVENDSGLLRDGFQQFLGAPEVAKMIQPHNVTDREEAVLRVKQGLSDFALVIPEDFSPQVLQGKEAAWEMILGRDYGKNLTAQMVFRAFLNQTNLIQSSMIAADPAVAASLQSQTQAALAGQQLDIGSFVRDGKLAGAEANYTAAQYYAASILIMFLLYSGMATSLGLMSEKEQHTLARLNAMPVKEFHIVAGKVAGNAVIACLQSFVIIAATKLLYGVDWGHSYLYLALVCLILIIISKSMAIIGMLIAGTTKAVNTIFQAVILVMTFFSGGFTPMPEGFMQTLGKFTVNSWGMQSIIHMMIGSADAVVSHHVLVLAAIGAGLTLAALIIYKKVGYHE